MLRKRPSRLEFPIKDRAVVALFERAGWKKRPVRLEDLGDGALYLRRR